MSAERVVWEDPPPRAIRWVDRLQPLDEHPGRWARFGPFSLDGAAYAVKRVRSLGYEGERRHVDGDTYVFARSRERT